jgi:heme-degrading monooxygenase HmoA
MVSFTCFAGLWQGRRASLPSFTIGSVYNILSLYGENGGLLFLIGNLHRKSVLRKTRKEMQMTVKIFIKRKVSPTNVTDLAVHLKKLRSLTLSQTGYIYGETLKRVDKKDECMVISTWRSLDDWNAWLGNSERITIQQEIDKLLGEKTEYAVYEV